MPKRKKQNNSGNTKLAFYFGVFIVTIIAISLLFKVFDAIRSSKYDGDNRFTVASVYKNRVDFISVSPASGEISRLQVDDLSDYKSSNIPTDGVIRGEELEASTKGYFSKALLSYNRIDTDLSFYDLVRLAFYSRAVSDEKVREEKVSFKNSEEFSEVSSTLFADQKIVDEDLDIQITNASDQPGVGNSTAKFVTNLGGNVILVNTASEPEKKSILYYSNESYTSKRLSKLLNVPSELRKDDSIADIIIILGED